MLPVYIIKPSIDLRKSGNESNCSGVYRWNIVCRINNVAYECRPLVIHFWANLSKVSANTHIKNFAL